MPVSLNADVGEGWGRYECGNDAALMAHITAASVACGMHAGDPFIMARTVRLAKQHGVSVGAHPGFNDVWGFGRRRIDMTGPDIEALVAYQIGALQAIAAREGVAVRYVKPHGALNNIAEFDLDVAMAIARAIHAVDPDLLFVANAGSQMLVAGEKLGLRTLSEGYADRRYGADGRVLGRHKPEAMIREPQVAARQVQAMLHHGIVETIDGGRIKIKVETVCLHGDEPASEAIARSVRAAIDTCGVELVAI